MNYQFFALLLFVSLSASALIAQEAVSTHSIEAALEDGLYSLAEQQIWEELGIQHTPDEKAALTILLIRALIGEEKLDEAVTLSEESSTLPQQDAFAYWRARALFESGKTNALFRILKEGEPLPTTGAYAPAALRLRGRAEQSAGDLKAAQKTFESFRARYPMDKQAAQNLFDLAKAYLQRNRKSDSIKTLQELLERFPDDALADTARLELARQLMALNGKDESSEASVLLTTLASKSTAHPRLRSAAWVELSGLEQRAGKFDGAIDALAQAEKLTSEAALRVRQKAVRANWLIDQSNPKEAFVLFDEAVKESPDTATAADVMVQKAEALLKTQQFAPAEKAFQSGLDIATDPILQSRALAGKGWSLWEQQRYEEASVAFENSAAKSEQSDLCATALIKAGDARLAAGQYEKARENYRRMASTYPHHPLVARAFYQSAIASLRAGQPDAARADFDQIENQFPQSEFAPQAALQQAEMLKREQKWNSALEQYRRIAARYTNSAVQATSVQQQGLILYRIGQWDAALESFRRVSTNWPESPETPQALYMRGFCRYLQGDTADALSLCQSFIQKYPDSIWTTEVLFWLGQHDYNRGGYAQAQATFSDIAARFPKHELADDALFWAGHALLKQDQFLEAFAFFSRLAKENPDSPLLLKTRFAQGETLTELGEFPRAILAYEEVIKTAPDDPLADRARGRLADCLFTLGSSEPGRYQEALMTYQALYKRPAAPFALKLQALYKLARCETKLGLNEKAFAHYMEVVYSGTGQTEPLSPEAAPWFTRAAFDAAATQEEQQQWKQAVHIYNRIIQAGVLATAEAQKRIEKIEREHASAF